MELTQIAERMKAELSPEFHHHIDTAVQAARARRSPLAQRRYVVGVFVALRRTRPDAGGRSE